MKRMKTKILFITIALIIITANLAAQETGTSTDPRDGKIYKTVKIGIQTWTTENLNVCTFRNGDTIQEVKTASEWKRLSKEQKPVWCYYEYNQDNENKYGKLYNFYAVADTRVLAPEGWHIPNLEEWDLMITSMGSAISNIKSASGWDLRGSSPTGYSNGTNESGFSGLPGGYCNHLGVFDISGSEGVWWTSSQTTHLLPQSNKNFAWIICIDGTVDYIVKTFFSKRDGISVRCIKD
jgi:uncharacterized protein (TIGR02145 family)